VAIVMATTFVPGRSVLRVKTPTQKEELSTAKAIGAVLNA